jgi:hypothetical protein
MSIAFKPRTERKSVCTRCKRKRSEAGKMYCSRCEIIVGREGKISPKDITICLRCGRKRPETNYAYCERCLILIEREIGVKVLPLNAPVPSIDDMLKTEAPKTPEKKLCNKCNRREPDEGEEYCFRCKVLMEREKQN